jgi:D-alanine-D-alanine ligase
MKRKLRVAVLFGGKSAEHEVSLRSAKNVIAALDPKKYEVIAIGIEKSGRWLPASASQRKLLGAPESLTKNETTALAILPEGNGELIGASDFSSGAVDVVFPVLHGPFGEDGTVQGLLKLANVPFVGPGVLGSAVGMDKDITKRLLRDAGIPIGNFLTATKSDSISFKDAKKKLGIPLFIKPANLGSSVGVYKVKSEVQYNTAITNALKFDTKILIEEFIKGREVECAVLGNENPKASIVGEIIPHHEFYSYEAKYLDENGAGLEIPAKISKKIEKQIQDMAIKTFKTIGCEGMGRVDCFLKEDGTVLVNEINTIPGFTSISMYPKLWEASGIPRKKLVDTLIVLAIARFKRDSKLKTHI